MRTALLAALAAASLSAAVPAAAAAPKGVIEDDYPRALTEAKARNVPMLVDVWAPW